MAFGAAPRCTRCETAVYHAEQALGPARKIYHKACLKCENCGKRLDPGNLVEHDTLPYCSRCHTQLFGTRDLRHANVNPASPAPSTPSKTPSRSGPALSPLVSPKAPTPRPLPPSTEYYTPPKLTSNAPITPDLPLNRDPSTPVTRPNFREARPISVPYAGKLESFDERGLMRRGDSPRSKVGEKVIVGEEQCWACEKRVYAAEQVFAVGHKWHRACLKCTSCKTTLDPSKVSDHDGIPKCRVCYAKDHGPEGIMGKR